MITDINQLDTTQTYTYAQYLTWRFAERVELIKGRLFKMSPAPARKHQRISQKLSFKLEQQLISKKCELYTAPFVVRFPKKNRKDGVTDTVVQPVMEKKITNLKIQKNKKNNNFICIDIINIISV